MPFSFNNLYFVNMNLYPVAVVDNFYQNPDEIRAFALKQKFTYRHELEGINYVFPGSRTKDLFEISPDLYKSLCNKLISLFHVPDHDIMRWAITTSFQLVEAKYGSGIIHQDQNTIFAGVIYLTPEAPLNSGTSLFQKNKQFDEQRFEEGLKLNDERFINNQPIDFSYHDMFDEIVRVNNVYNTMIVFEGDIPHCANEFFGDSPQNSRLTQVFFVSKIEANKQTSFPISRINMSTI